jgi:uncharacterized repeat protein (TIGR03987 family)
MFFVAALVLYTAAIVGSKVSNTLTNIMVMMFGAGLASDILGTTMLCASSKTWSWGLHSIAGLVALLVMAVHFVWCMLARRGSRFTESVFIQHSSRAWLLWLFSFVSGVPADWGTRMLLVVIVVLVTIALGFCYSIARIRYQKDDVN